MKPVQQVPTRYFEWQYDGTNLDEIREFLAPAGWTAEETDDGFTLHSPYWGAIPRTADFVYVLSAAPDGTHAIEADFPTRAAFEALWQEAD